VSSRSSPHLVTGESIVRRLVIEGAREDGPKGLERTLVRLALREENELKRQGVVVEHDAFWEHNASEWAKQHPEVEDARETFHYTMLVAAYLTELREHSLSEWERYFLDGPGRLGELERSVVLDLLSHGVSMHPSDPVVVDLAQETRWKTLRLLHSFHPWSGSFEGWVEQTRRNIVRTYLGRVKRTVPSGLEVGDEEIDPFSGEEVLLDDAFLKWVRDRVIPSLEREPHLGEVVSKKRRGETLTETETKRWKRNRHRLIELCEKRGLTRESL
jgi:hypothetical protein